MKALTLWQPWASLIAANRKPFETRSWPPPAALIGERIAIHAAARRPITDLDEDLIGTLEDEFGGHWWRDIPRGAIVCTAVMRNAYQVLTGRIDSCGCVDLGRRVPGSDDLCGVTVDAFGDYRQGRWLWHLTDVVPIDPPLPARGYQGIWEWAPPIDSTEDPG